MLRAAVASLALLAPLALAASLAGCSEGAADRSASATTATYVVEGMHCGHCVDAITARVRETPGVVACDVSLEGRSMTVALDDPSARERVAEAVRRLGYTVTAR